MNCEHESQKDMMDKTEEAKEEKNGNKYRGTRRQQRYRAKQKLLTLNELDTKSSDVNDITTHDQIAPSMDVDMMLTTAIGTSQNNLICDHVIQSFSQLSLIQSVVPTARANESLSSINVRQKRARISFHGVRKAKQRKKEKRQFQKNQDLSLPDYLNVPNRVFKCMFVTASEHFLTNEQKTLIYSWLNTSTNMKYIRTHVKIMDKLLYLQSQQTLWAEYLHVGTQEDGIWASEIQDKIRRMNTNDSTTINPLTFVTSHQNYIDINREKTENELKNHTDKINKLCQHKSQIKFIDLSAISKAFVRHGQHRLNAEIQCKKKLLHYDWQDNQLNKRFFDLKPTNKQIDLAKAIWKASFEEQVAEEQIAIYKHQLFSKQLPKKFNSLDHTLNNLYVNSLSHVIDNNTRTILNSRYNKIIDQVKLDMMAVSIATVEATARAYGKTVRLKLEQFKSIVSSNRCINHDQDRINNLLKIIEARRDNIVKRARYVTACKRHRRSIKNQHFNFTNILPSSAIVEAASSFRKEHLFILAYGPKYVLKYQHYFMSPSLLNKIIQREYDMMTKIISNSLTDNCVSISDNRAIQFFASLKALITELYQTKLPDRVLCRARKEYKLMHTIRRKLCSKNNQIVLRRTDKSKVFHIGLNKDYHHKAMAYMDKTCAYEKVKENKCPLQHSLSVVITLLDKLLKSKAITLQQYLTMKPNRDKLELGHLYFLPKPHKIGTPLRPIISSMNGPINAVSHFLDRLLRPIFDRVAEQTTFINGIDLIRKLETYRNRGRLLSSTLFITFDVTDLYTMIPRDGSLTALGRFLVRHSTNQKIGNLSVDTILKLARLVLDMNYFAYESTYYRQIKGGAMGSPFTMTLANVYMLEWEQPLIELQLNQGELYGRYIDDVFMTSNMSRQVIQDQLDLMNRRDKDNIRITYSIDSSADFLDVHIKNSQGVLKTCVYHKPAAEPYILPFSSNHPRHIHVNIPYEALLRAARYCSDVYAFDEERLRIEMTLLLNGYPPAFLERHFKRFFRLNQAVQVALELDVLQYNELHQKLLYLPTRREKHTKKLVESHSQDTIPLPLGNTHLTKKWNRKLLRVPYTFQSGPLLTFREKFRNLWTHSYVYQGSPMKAVRLSMITLSSPSLNDLLVRKKPAQLFLSKMEFSASDNDSD